MSFGTKGAVSPESPHTERYAATAELFHHVAVAVALVPDALAAQFEVLRSPPVAMRAGAGEDPVADCYCRAQNQTWCDVPSARVSVPSNS